MLLTSSALTISNIIQLISVGVALLLGLVGIVISLNTQREQRKVLTEQRRPKIVAYIDYIWVSSTVQKYLVFKNVGNSVAYVDETEISYSSVKDIKQRDMRPLRPGAVLAPGQKISSSLIYVDKASQIDIVVSYHDDFGWSSIYNQHLELDAFSESMSDSLTVKGGREVDTAIINAARALVRHLS